MDIVCIIPARGGSKGIPNKNIRTIAGLPLIAHSILQAKKSQLVSRIYVSTDDPKISSTAQSFGAEVISRPPEISGDHATSESALLHALNIIETIGISPQLVVFLQCTSPLRQDHNIDQAIQQLLDEKADSLLSVSPSHRFIWEKSADSIRSVNYDYAERKRRQDMPLQFVENGSIYIFKPWILKHFNNRLGGKISLYCMRDEDNFEIDTQLDFEIVEFLLNRRNHHDY